MAINNFSAISFLVIASALAVNAITGMPGNCCLKTANCKYSGLKSCPHILTQWASSMANNVMGSDFRNSINRPPSLMMRSGATYNNFISPLLIRLYASCCSTAFMLLFKAMAGIPIAFKPSTWSFINAISGETTMVIPGSNMAGI